MATLYILGNGFDLAHGLPTKYECFRSFLRDNKGKTLLSGNNNIHGTFGEVLEDLEKFYPEISRDANAMEWNNFEAALANPNPQFANSMNQLSYSTFFKDRLVFAFSAWAASINPRRSITRLGLDKTASFVTFNYTMTLEEVYGIPKEQILHLHGSAEMYSVSQSLSRVEWEDSEIIFGHGQKTIKNNPLASQFYKDTEKVFVSKRQRLVSMIPDKTRIDEIRCYGHSLEDVDAFYFRQLATLFPKAIWYLGFHGQLDETQLEKEKWRLSRFARENGIANFYVKSNSQIIREVE